MYIRPIPIDFLQDSVTVQKVTKDSMGRITTTEEIYLKNVCVQVGEKNSSVSGNIVVTDTKGNNKEVFKYTLYFDATNSIGDIHNVVPNDIIVYKGLDLIVGKIDENSVFGKVHHYKLGLM